MKTTMIHCEIYMMPCFDKLGSDLMLTDFRGPGAILALSINTLELQH